MEFTYKSFSSHLLSGKNSSNLSGLQSIQVLFNFLSAMVLSPILSTICTSNSVLIVFPKCAQIAYAPGPQYMPFSLHYKCPFPGKLCQSYPKNLSFLLWPITGFPHIFITTAMWQFAIYKARRGGMEQILPLYFADTLISYFQHPELWDHKSLWLKTPSLWHFVKAALEN